MKALKIGLGVLAVLVAGLLVAVRVRHGGGKPFADRSTAPLLPASALEVVATLDEPAGNIAVSSTGRIFFTVHPESRPEKNKVVELVNGKPVPYPDAASQALYETVLGVRIDRQERLWTIDHGTHGLGRPRLLAFDLATNTLVHRYDFPKEIAGAGSFFNDLVIDPSGKRVYIADTSVFGKTPALVVYDVEKKQARRLLENDASVREQDWIINAKGHEMVFFGGLMALKPAVDSIALDRKGEWVYFGAMTHETLFRVRTADLNDETLDAKALSARVETFGPKVLSDGLSTDLDGNVYLTDVEHGAIALLGQDHKLQTLLRDPRLRWPDGLSFGPDHWLYLADSDIPDIMLQSKAHVRASAPYYVFRFKPGHPGIPGQ